MAVLGAFHSPDAHVDDLLTRLDHTEPAMGDHMVEGTGLSETFEGVINALSFLSIPFAIAAIVLLGVMVAGASAAGSPEGASKHLKKMVGVLLGLVIVLNAAQLVRLVAGEHDSLDFESSDENVPSNLQ